MNVYGGESLMLPGMWIQNFLSRPDKPEKKQPKTRKWTTQTPVQLALVKGWQQGKLTSLIYRQWECQVSWKLGPSLKLKQPFIGMKGELNPQTDILALGLSTEASRLLEKYMLTRQVQLIREFHVVAIWDAYWYMWLQESLSSRRLPSATGAEIINQIIKSEQMWN